MTSREQRGMRSLTYELFILLVSILSIVNLMALVVTRVTGIGAGAPNDVVLLIEVALTPVFLADFLYRLYRAKSRNRYFFGNYGWADLLSAIPLLRIFRIVHIIRVIQAIRRRGREQVWAELAESRAAATFAITIFLVFVVLEIAGASIFAAESPDPAANIKSAGDALWWGLVTITTVGYGDKFPVTPAGRVIGVFLLFAGIALFSVLTGFIANAFLAPRRRRRRLAADSPIVAIDHLRKLLDEQQERSDEIRQQLDELERTMAESTATQPIETG